MDLCDDCPTAVSHGLGKLDGNGQDTDSVADQPQPCVKSPSDFKGDKRVFPGLQESWKTCGSLLVGGRITEMEGDDCVTSSR